MMLKNTFISCTLILLSCFSFAQHKPTDNPYENQWKKADSLMKRGLPKSAITIVEEIFKQSENKKDAANKIKAQLFLINANQSITEHFEIERIRQSEQNIISSSGVEKALWQSISAQFYWNYYRQNRYKLLQRTTIATTTSEDIDTWDAQAFFNKIAHLYRSSIENKSILQQTPVEH